MSSQSLLIQSSHNFQPHPEPSWISWYPRITIVSASQSFWLLATALWLTDRVYSWPTCLYSKQYLLDTPQKKSQVALYYWSLIYSYKHSSIFTVHLHWIFFIICLECLSPCLRLHRPMQKSILVWPWSSTQSLLTPSKAQHKHTKAD